MEFTYANEAEDWPFVCICCWDDVSTYEISMSFIYISRLIISSALLLQVLHVSAGR